MTADLSALINCPGPSSYIARIFFSCYASAESALHRMSDHYTFFEWPKLSSQRTRKGFKLSIFLQPITDDQQKYQCYIGLTETKLLDGFCLSAQPSPVLLMVLIFFSRTEIKRCAGCSDCNVRFSTWINRIRTPRWIG